MRVATTATTATAATAKASPVRIERIARAKGAVVAVVWLESEPVNSMTLELWSALADALTSLENDSTVRRAARGS
jgi:enoyl-CoA hydratase/carnithine racemase